MALKGNTRESQIWNYLMSVFNNAYGVAGLMGNIYSESGLNPKNLQNTYEKKLNYTDDSYTDAVDDGSYRNFVNDKAGYGLCQWTYYSRKQRMIDYHRSKNKSIGDLETQLEFLVYELKTFYNSIYQAMMSATSVKEASDVVLHKFEAPADQSTAVEEKRASFGQKYYDKYAKIEATSNTNGGTIMSNSSLVNVKVMSPNHSGKRTKPICRITPHCVVGQLSASGIGGCFPAGRQASCNYGIGKDGQVCLIVDECNRSWCSSSNDNDQQAVTIECASDMSEPYAFNSAVYNKLIELSADICRRNGKNKLVWISDKNKALAYKPKSNEMLVTVHRWFANKSCPGNWLMGKMNDYVSKVNAKLGSGSSTPQTPQTPSKPAGKVTTKEVSGKLTVTYKGSDGVEVHNTPDFNSSSCNKTHGPVGPATKKGSVFTVKAEVTLADGSKMYQLKSGLYITASTKYVKFSQTSSSTPAKPAEPAKPKTYTVKVTADVLNIRKGPGTNYGTNGAIRDNGIYTIVDESDGKGAKKWGKLKSGAGWISLDYTKRT